MKDFFESFSLSSGAILIAAVSLGVVWLLYYVLPVGLRWLSVVIVPFIFAYCLYWIPVWLGEHPSEYSAWAGLCIGTWFLAGSIPSAALVLILRKRPAK